METCRGYNQETVKQCTRCKKIKLLSEFNRKKDGKFGRYSHCKECKSKTDRKYGKDNKEKITSRYKHWSLKNRDIINKASRKYYYKNREKHLVLTRNRRARMRNAEGSFTLKEWEELKDRHNNRCAECGKSEPFNQYRKYLTIDHIIPLSKNGTNYISNIQPLCFVCNSVKKDKVKG